MSPIKAFIAGVFIATLYEKIYAMKGLTGFKSKLRMTALILIAVLSIVELLYFGSF
ncbi:TPA: hypothetical protein ACFP4Y_000398 [Neisseria bacilliformis]|uniref:hypothetical protein n=1 Tax=Neisseria bacilliformis TaxID=267212 RepID=UPI000A50C1C1|nr:hypothetical protein [Neisseria bacilliformis]